MKKLIIIPVLLLAACASKPDTGLAPPPKIPELTLELKERAGPLEPITDFTTNGLIESMTTDRKQYNKIGSQLNKVLDIYECVRESFNRGDKEVNCL